MKKRMLSIVLVIALALSLFTACGNDVLTQEQAQKIAIKEAGVAESDITDIHTHVIDENGIPCYNVHISTADEELSYNIHASTGEIISSGNGGH